MHIIVPKKIEELERLLEDLQRTKLDDICKLVRNSRYYVALHLPKFKIESTLNLVEPLKQVTALFIGPKE